MVAHQALPISSSFWLKSWTEQNLNTHTNGSVRYYLSMYANLGVGQPRSSPSTPSPCSFSAAIRLLGRCPIACKPFCVSFIVLLLVMLPPQARRRSSCANALHGADSARPGPQSLLQRYRHNRNGTRSQLLCLHSIGSNLHGAHRRYRFLGAAHPRCAGPASSRLPPHTAVSIFLS